MGKSFVEYLNSWFVGEQAVDCNQCQVKSPLTRSEKPRPYKCCTFQPFWSAFLVGSQLLKSGSSSQLDALVEGAVFLPVGITPLPESRARQQHLSMVERSQSKEMVCPYYQQQNGSCRIFTYRPLECRRYYCATANQGRQAYRQYIFEQLSAYQANLLQGFLLEQGYELQDWDLWTQYLEPNGFRSPPHGEFPSWAVAAEFYLRAGRWLENHRSRIEEPALPVLDEFYESYKRSPTEIG